MTKMLQKLPVDLLPPAINEAKMMEGQNYDDAGQAGRQYGERDRGEAATWDVLEWSGARSFA